MFAAMCAGGVNQGISTMVFSLPEGAVVATFGGPATPSGDAGETAGPVKPGKKPSRKVGTSKSSYASGILARNVFDSSSIGKEPEGGDDDAGVSDLKVKLLATMVAVPAAFSTAFIVREGVEGSGSGYGIGDMIMGAQVLTISAYEVKIRRADGEEEVIKMSTDVTKGAKKASKAKSDDDGITKDGDNKYTVDQSLVDQYLGDLEGISKLGRAIPHRGSDGSIDGYRLSGIRRGTAGEKLGIRNGDIVHKVNGYDLTSMSEAMKAFQELQKEDSFNFELTRRGKKQTMEYDVR